MSHEQRLGNNKMYLTAWIRRSHTGTLITERKHGSMIGGLISVHWANQQFRLSGSWNMCSTIAWYERAADEDPTPTTTAFVSDRSRRKKNKEQRRKKTEPSINSINSFFIIRVDFFSSIVHVGWMEELSSAVWLCRRCSSERVGKKSGKFKFDSQGKN